MLSPLLTELLTTCSPASTFFRPVPFLLFITIGYGFPVLVIREIACRGKLGLPALFCLGVIYGLYNEGLLARTIINPFHSPIDTFAIYGLIGDFRVPWLLAITFWHAMHAVIYPVMFVDYLFPADSRIPWVSKRTAWVLGVFCLALATLAFFSKGQVHRGGSLPDFLVMVVCAALLWLASKRFGAVLRVSPSARGPVSWKSAGFGVLIYLGLFFIPLLFSRAGLRTGLYFGYFAVLSFLGARVLSRIPEVSPRRMVFVGLGGECMVALLTFLVAKPFGKTEQAASSALFLIIFLTALVRMALGGAADAAPGEQIPPV